MAFLTVYQEGGILISLINKCFLILVVSTGTGCSSNQSKNLTPQLCVEKVLNVKIVRTDEKNKRYFLVDSNFSEEKIINNITKLRQCFISTDWSGNWSISLFTEKKYAGYKDENGIVQYHRENKWAKSYQFEYSEKDKQLIYFPAINPEIIYIK